MVFFCISLLELQEDIFFSSRDVTNDEAFAGGERQSLRRQQRPVKTSHHHMDPHGLKGESWRGELSNGKKRVVWGTRGVTNYAVMLGLSWTIFKDPY